MHSETARQKDGRIEEKSWKKALKLECLRDAAMAIEMIEVMRLTQVNVFVVGCPR